MVADKHELTMNKIQILILNLFIVLCCSCNSDRQKSKFNEEKSYNEMFKVGIRNTSTAPDFIVFTAINRDNQLKKEICCESNLVNELRSSEYDIDTDNNSITFSNKAYSIIGADKYDYLIVDSLLRTITPSLIDSICKEHEQNGYSKLLEAYTLKYGNAYFQHVLFKNRILTYRDCESGFTVIKKKY